MTFLTRVSANSSKSMDPLLARVLISANILDTFKKSFSAFAEDPKFVKEAYKYAAEHRLLNEDNRGNVITTEEEFAPYLVDYYNDAIKLLTKELKFEKGKLQIWRAIKVENPETYLAGLKRGYYGPSRSYYVKDHYKGLGIFWSWRYEKNMPTPNSDRSGEKLILKGLVDFDAIDVKETALKALDASDFFSEEKEIRLRENAKVELVDVLDKNGNSILDKPISVVAAAKSFPVFRAVKDLLPEQIDDHFHGKGVFGSGTYYALEEETAFKYATGEITSAFKNFAIVMAYKMQAKNPLTLTPKLVSGLSMEETGGWITFKNDEDAEDLGLHSSFERDRLAQMASDNDYDAIIIKGPKNKIDGGNQVLIPIGSKVTLTPTHFSVLIKGDMEMLEFSRMLRKKLGGEEYARHYAIGVSNVPIAKLKELAPLLKSRKSK